MQTDQIIENPIINQNGNVLYLSEIKSACEDYISSLPDPNMIYTKSAFFRGMLFDIYNKYIKQIIDYDKQVRNSTYNNYLLLDELFNKLYIPVCYMFNKVPTVSMFCTCLVNIDCKNITDIKNGIYRTDRATANPETSHIVRKWYNTCESSLESKAYEENSIGSIFGLKSAFNWTESPQQIEVLHGSSPTPEQIAERYKNREKPKLEIPETNDK